MEGSALKCTPGGGQSPMVVHTSPTPTHDHICYGDSQTPPGTPPCHGHICHWGPQPSCPSCILQVGRKPLDNLITSSDKTTSAPPVPLDEPIRRAPIPCGRIPP
ncbi:partitioning defective 6-like protein gamma [Platysternon megacephalum]|uniref:Partitioning defective 6-like protein gamma n=1 Tax=Platysternon megacephalum TaxID=55544 RepID=A0A4D9E6D8_9SAUR|nr:partitioning defective 6-like protein gamma [Platysternon megacephalum]